MRLACDVTRAPGADEWCRQHSQHYVARATTLFPAYISVYGVEQQCQTRKEDVQLMGVLRNAMTKFISLRLRYRRIRVEGIISKYTPSVPGSLMTLSGLLFQLDELVSKGQL